MLRVETKRGGGGGEAKGPGCGFSGWGPRIPVPNLHCAGLCLQDHHAGSMGQRRPLWMPLFSCASESWAEWCFLCGPLHLRVPDWLLQPRKAALQHSTSVKEAPQENALVAVMWLVNGNYIKGEGGLYDMVKWEEQLILDNMISPLFIVLCYCSALKIKTRRTVPRLEKLAGLGSHFRIKVHFYLLSKDHQFQRKGILENKVI